MKVLNYGSLNIDFVYNVNHLVKPGETISCEYFNQNCGGKGLNQSIALAKAGLEVYHAGKVGKNGQTLIDCLKENGVDSRYVVMDKQGVSGHAIIQVDKSGENSIIIHGGTNQNISRADIDETLKGFSKGDFLLLQNEINEIEYIMKKAKEKGVRIVLNPAPIDINVKRFPLDLVDVLVVNEIEGQFFTGELLPEVIINKISKQLPKCIIILTLGKNGSMVFKDGCIYKRAADKNVNVVDTTAAGDTFIGYMVYCIAKEKNINDSLSLATKASAYCIGHNGAASSIPRIEELKQGEKNYANKY